MSRCFWDDWFNTDEEDQQNIHNQEMQQSEQIEDHGGMRRVFQYRQNKPTRREGNGSNKRERHQGVQSV